MGQVSFGTHPDLLVGLQHGADAAVYQLSPEIAIVQSADYFPPMLPDPVTFGRIAAANALSDIYAFGARPVTALNLLTLPREADFAVIAQMLAEVARVVESTGAVIAGGHTILGPQLEFGLSVTGVVHPDRLIRNTTAKPGDVLVLTKPLGTGVLVHAYNHGNLGEGSAADTALAPAIECMTTLNREAAELMAELGAHAATDITGFGVLLHALDMLGGGQIGIELDWASVPLLPRAAELAPANICGGSARNAQYLAKRQAPDGSPTVRYAGDPTSGELAMLILADAQTSGGLLIALPPSAAHELLAGLRERGYGLSSAIVGRVTSEHPGAIVVR